MEVGAQAAGGSVLDRAGHAVLDVGKVLGDVQGALHLGLKSDNFGRGGRVLQVIESSAVGEGGHISAQLHRSKRNALTKAAHAGHATLGCGQFRVRIDAQLFAFNVVAGQLAQAELGGVVADALKAQLPAQLLEIEVIAFGQRLGHVHAETGQLDRGVARNQALGERGHGDGNLDGGAGLSARRKGQFLIDHGQDAPVGGVDDHGGAVHVAHGVDGRLADHRVLASRHVACKNVSAGIGTGAEMLIEAMAARGEGCAAQMGSRAASSGHMGILPC